MSVRPAAIALMLACSATVWLTPARAQNASPAAPAPAVLTPEQRAAAINEAPQRLPEIAPPPSLIDGSQPGDIQLTGAESYSMPDAGGAPPPIDWAQVFGDSKTLVNTPVEGPPPFGWYPPGAGMGGLPPVPKRNPHPQTLHDTIVQNETVRLRGGGLLRLYGFFRGDYDEATHRFNDLQNPFFVLPNDPSFVSGPGAVPIDPKSLNYSLYPRLTRAGLEYYGLPIPDLDCAVPSGRLEIDFLTSNPSGPESRELLRLRLAYAQIQHGDFTLVVGQDWDIVSPLNPSINDNTLQWNNGNLGDRRPQVKLMWDHDYGDDYHLQWQNGLAMADAINSIDSDGDGLRDNEASGVPGYEARLGFIAPSWVTKKKITAGVWGLLAEDKTTLAFATRHYFPIWGVGTDLHLPLSDLFTLRTEFFHGANLDDFRGGIQQGINLATGDPIRTSGGWVEMVANVTDMYQASVGWSTDDPLNRDIGVLGRTRNAAIYTGHRLNFGRGLIAGSDIQFWRTEWKSFAAGEAVLMKFFLQYNY